MPPCANWRLRCGAAPPTTIRKGDMADNTAPERTPRRVADGAVVRSAQTCRSLRRARSPARARRDGLRTAAGLSGNQGAGRHAALAKAIRRRPGGTASRQSCRTAELAARQVARGMHPWPPTTPKSSTATWMSTSGFSVPAPRSTSQYRWAAAGWWWSTVTPPGRWQHS